MDDTPLGALPVFNRELFVEAIRRARPGHHVGLELVAPFEFEIPSDQSAVVVAVAIPPQPVPTGAYLNLRIDPLQHLFHPVEDAMVRYRRFAEDRSLLADMFSRMRQEADSGPDADALIPPCACTRASAVLTMLRSYERLLHTGPSILWRPLLIPPRTMFSGRAFCVERRVRKHPLRMEDQRAVVDLFVHVTLMLSRNVA